MTPPPSRAPRALELSGPVEDYLKAIYELERSGEAAELFAREEAQPPEEPMLQQWVEEDQADFDRAVLISKLVAQAQPRIDPANIGLIGHSEGAWVAPMAYAPYQAYPQAPIAYQQAPVPVQAPLQPSNTVPAASAPSVGVPGLPSTIENPNMPFSRSPARKSKSCATTSRPRLLLIQKRPLSSSSIPPSDASMSRSKTTGTSVSASAPALSRIRSLSILPADTSAC